MIDIDVLNGLLEQDPIVVPALTAMKAETANTFSRDLN